MAFPSWCRSKRGGAGGLALALALSVFSGCRTAPTPPAALPPAAEPAPAPPPEVVPPGAPLLPPTPVRQGDEIVVAGRLFHTGTRVLTWMDPAGYNAYPGARLVRHRQTVPDSSGSGRATKDVTDLAGLQGTVDQFVLHYDACGMSAICFKTLHERGLSVHFLLDLDGTIYQTLDLQEHAEHATTANNRSIGIEIANLGGFPPGETKVLTAWIRRDAEGQVFLQPPKAVGPSRIYTKDFIARPTRPGLIRGAVQGRDLVQIDYTPEQYRALGKLTAALCTVFPRIKADYPRDAAGGLLRAKLSDAALDKFSGILGHYHIQANKADPGPAFQWDKILPPVVQASPP